MEKQDIVKALWAKRQPDDSWQPCNWVRVYTWRGDNCNISITEFEEEKHMRYRLDGHYTIDGKTERIHSQQGIRLDVAEALVSRV